MQTFSDYLSKLVKNRKPIIVIMAIYSIFCIASAIYFFVVGRINNGFTCILYSLFVVLIMLFEYSFKLIIPPALLILLTFIPIGSILGSFFDFFAKISWFDDFLHCASGFIYACVGFGLFKHFVGEIKNTRKFLTCLLGAITFSLSIGVLWEIYEFIGSSFGRLDMEEDTLINSFHSYFVSGTHKSAGIINDIIKTEIYYGDGLIQTIPNGYLDLGLIDTLNDMLVCFIGSLFFLVLVLMGSKKKIYNGICPVLPSETKYFDTITEKIIGVETLEIEE